MKASKFRKEYQIVMGQLSNALGALPMANIGLTKDVQNVRSACCCTCCAPAPPLRCRSLLLSTYRACGLDERSCAGCPCSLSSIPLLDSHPTGRERDAR